MKEVNSKNLVLFSLGIISGGAMLFLAHRSPWYGVMQSFFAGFLFWIVFGFFPERQQRNVVHDFLKKRYRSFRLNVVVLLLATGGFNREVKAENLVSHNKFREFFSQRDSANGCDYLERATNGMRDCEAFINDLTIEFDLFSEAVDFALNNLATRDLKALEAFSFLKRRLSDITRKSCYTGDQMKYIDNFIWKIMGMWSDVRSELPSDWIEDAIEGLRK